MTFHKNSPADRAIRGFETLNGKKAGKSTRVLIRKRWWNQKPDEDFTKQWRKDVSKNLRSE